MRRSTKILLGGLAVLAGLSYGGYRLLVLERDPAELTLGAAVALNELRLTAPDGQPFDPATLGAGRLPVLLFYRGHW